MIRGAVVAGVVMVLGALGGVAHAQMPASALGKSRVTSKLPPGEVTVRVLKGSLSDPLSGLDVILVQADAPDGQKPNEKLARTNPQGRAIFKALKPGTKWIAKVSYEGEDTASDPFVVSDQGGMRIALSPVEWKVTQSAAGGRPPPRTMAGQPRPLRNLDAGTLKVQMLRGTYDAMVDGGNLHLVGIRADGKVAHRAVKTNATGLYIFEGLPGRDVAYYLLSTLDRKGAQERLMSVPITMLPGVGLSIVLSGEPPESEAGADDLAERYADQSGVEPGVAQVRIVGDKDEVNKVTEVELVEVSTGEVVAKAGAVEEHQRVDGDIVAPTPMKGVPSRTVVFAVSRGKSTTPVQGIPVQLTPTGGAPIDQDTGDRGTASFSGLQPGVEYTPAVVMFGERIEGEPFEIPANGPGLAVLARVSWEGQVKKAEFKALPGGPDHVYLPRTRIAGTLYFAPPFQLVPGKGAVVPLNVLGKPAFNFSLSGSLQDEYFRFDGTIIMTNGPTAPYSFGGDVPIPLPRGVVHAIVEDRYSTRVIFDQAHDRFLWKGAVPPGGFKFRMAFTLKIEDGAFNFNLDLPYGALMSGMEMVWAKGMKVDVYGNAAGGPVTQGGHTRYVLDDINVSPGQSIRMRVKGLPKRAAWSWWAKMGVGAVVLCLVGWIMVVLLFGRRRGEGMAPGASIKRDRLFNELVQLEHKFREGDLAEAKYRKQRARVMRQLEPLYERDE